MPSCPVASFAAAVAHLVGMRAVVNDLIPIYVQLVHFRRFGALSLAHWLRQERISPHCARKSEEVEL